jgi:hypothetical protein
MTRPAQRPTATHKNSCLQNLKQTEMTNEQEMHKNMEIRIIKTAIPAVHCLLGTKVEYCEGIGEASPTDECNANGHHSSGNYKLFF